MPRKVQLEGQPKLVGACRLPVGQTGLHCSARGEIFHIVTETVGWSDSVSHSEGFATWLRQFVMEYFG